MRLPDYRSLAILAILAPVAVFFSGCPTVTQQLPAASTPSLVSVEDGNRQAVQPLPSGDFKALTLIGNVFTCAITFQVPTLTTFHIYMAYGNTPQQELFPVTQYTSDPVAANYYEHAIALYNPLQPVLLNNNGTQQQTIIVTFPKPPFPSTPAGVPASPAGTFPFPGAPLTVNIIDASGNPNYQAGPQHISVPLAVTLVTQGNPTPQPQNNPPVITSPLTGTATVGQPFSYTVTASNSPNSFSVSGLPPGLTFNSSTDVISGVPTGAGVYSIAMMARNAVGSGSAVLQLAVWPASAPAAARTPGTFTLVNFSSAGSLPSQSGGFKAVEDTNPGVNTPVVSYKKNGQPIPGVLDVPFNPPVDLATTHAAALGLAFTSDSCSSPNPSFNFGIICAGLDAGVIGATSTNEFIFTELLGTGNHPVGGNLKVTVSPASVTAAPTWVPLQAYCSPDGTLAVVVSGSTSSVSNGHVEIYDLVTRLSLGSKEFSYTGTNPAIAQVQLTQNSEVKITYSSNGVTQPSLIITVAPVPL
jgi:hypothetical protein